MHRSTRERNGTGFLNPAIEGENLRHMLRHRVGERRARTALWDSAKLQPLLLPRVHQNLATGETV